jgi:hypothetical protein
VVGVALLVVAAFTAMSDESVRAQAVEPTLLDAGDFVHGTYIIDKPGVYRLTEDISFNPNSPAILDASIEDGAIPPDVASVLGLTKPVDAYHAGMPLATQFLHHSGDGFAPGGPLDARYEPAAYGIGFFAAIAVQAEGVVIDLNGHIIEQSEEHALLQRFFAVIELADQPFVPSQGPSGFGDEIVSASDVIIKNGTIGRSSHHGIHGNANENVTISNVDFDGYEVGAVALNGVRRLVIDSATATNRKDVPVLGTFSSAMFIKSYVDHLVRSGSATTLTVGGVDLGASEIQQELREAINNTHGDVIVSPNVVGGRAVINSVAHPIEYQLFHNRHGVIDGNSYSFLVNNLGVAVGGFPSAPDDQTPEASENIRLTNVRVFDQRAFINEIPAIDTNGLAEGGTAVIDPIGAVFQTRNLHPDTGLPITISSLDDAVATYIGNPVANAQAFVAKAAGRGEFERSHLDITRLNMPESVLDWVEGLAGSETLAAINTSYLCNGDSMFHVNKGSIGFKMDAARNVKLVGTIVDGLVNLGEPGSEVCGNYSNGVSHPSATINGYGGAAVRGYTFAGSEDVLVIRAEVRSLSAMSGPAIGFAVLTDSVNVRLLGARATGIDAGWGDEMPAGGPNTDAYAAGFYVSADASSTSIVRGCASDMDGYDGTYLVQDHAADTKVISPCQANGPYGLPSPLSPPDHHTGR